MEEKFENAIENFFENTFGSLSLINEIILSVIIAILFIAYGINTMKKRTTTGWSFLLLGIAAIFTCFIKLVASFF